MQDRVAQVAALLHEAGETHHLVYRIVDGEDPDWASWYAGWLLEMVLGGAAARWRIAEVPVAYRPRAGGRSKVSGSVRGSARAIREMSAQLVTATGGLHARSRDPRDYGR